MQKEKCISIKKSLVDFMKQNYPDFVFAGSAGSAYAFSRESEGIYDYIILWRDFFEGNIYLSVSEVATCFNKSWKGVPVCVVGRGTSIGVLITGKNRYDACVGEHKCKNCKEELPGLYMQIKQDVDKYVLPYFENCRKELCDDKCKYVTGRYMQEQFGKLYPEEIAEMKRYLVEVNTAYSDYYKECKKLGKCLDTNRFAFDMVPMNGILGKWLTEIQDLLEYTHLSEDVRRSIIKYTTFLFRDEYDFYNYR